MSKTCNIFGNNIIIIIMIKSTNILEVKVMIFLIEFLSAAVLCSCIIIHDSLSLIIM